MHLRLRTVLEWVIVIVVALVVATAARTYAVQSFSIPTPSMTPTLQPGDRVLVDKLAGTIHRGDIVVFRNVARDVGGPPTLVKRVVAVPGDTISGTGTDIRIDGKRLAEPWLPPLTGICATLSRDIAAQHIGAGQYFVMGDCRGDSEDSRFWGTVPDSNIIGKVNVVIWRHNHPWLHWF